LLPSPWAYLICKVRVEGVVGQALTHATPPLAPPLAEEGARTQKADSRAECFLVKPKLKVN